MLAKATHILPAKGFFKANRQRLIQYLKQRVGSPENSYILLKGEVEQYIYDDDQTFVFQQDNNFWWTTGVDQPDCFSLISLANGECTIYTPEKEETMKYWMRIMELEEYTQTYEIDDARYLEKLQDDLKGYKPDAIYILGGVNKYSGKSPLAPDFEWLDQFNVNNTALYPSINEVKLLKSDEEIRLLKEAARIGSEAHIYVLQNVRPGVNESHVQTLFRFFCGMHGPTVQVPYEEICAAGKNAAILHYHHNSHRIEDGQMVLVDAGAKINGYNSDITVTFPINGKFTEKQRQIYEIVWAAHQEVRDNAKAGVHWQDLQNRAEKAILKGLLDLGLVQGGDVDELWENRISYYFFPHGIGHYIGVYVHDVQGDPLRENEKRNIKKQNLRVHRRLEESMVLTNEPGLYFIERLLEDARKHPELAQYFNFDLISQYAAEIQGVRIEDMMVIHADRAEGLTTVPRTVEQIEKCMAKQEWK